MSEQRNLENLARSAGKFHFDWIKIATVLTNHVLLVWIMKAPVPSQIYEFFYFDWPRSLGQLMADMLLKQYLKFKKTFSPPPLSNEAVPL